MTLPSHRTKIVCTLGPASGSPEVLDRMIRAGMNTARLNFSHGDLASHGEMIERVRAAASRAGRRIAILADLPGPKIRLGELAHPFELAIGDTFWLTTADVVGGPARAPVTFEPLPRVVRPGDAIFLNDGLVQLEVAAVEGLDVRCRVIAGGELRSRKGVNLPGVELGISAFTAHDRECLRFALAHGVDAISQSFVETGADVEAVRDAAAALGHDVFVIAKIERARALENLDEILRASDGIMIARGDLGVELPIEQIPIVQKQLARLARRLGKPVITATQMLESMTHGPRPTRAEATDVANAILDGTDCVMLSGESAIGAYPVEAVAMLARIAAVAEPHISAAFDDELGAPPPDARGDLVDLIARSVARTVRRIAPSLVVVPTVSGASARSVSRFRLPVWIAAVTPRPRVSPQLQLSFGVHPIDVGELPADWPAFARAWLAGQGLEGGLVVLTGGPSELHPDAHHRLELLDLRATPPRARA